VSPGDEPGPTTRTCTGYIDTVPATITSAGNWCLRADLTVNFSYGIAIVVDAAGATLDCRGHRLNNLPAGAGSTTDGVVVHQAGVTIRDCTLQGFQAAIFDLAQGGAGVIEDNRIERANRYGILADSALVRRNVVRDIGGGIHVVSGIVAPLRRFAEGNLVASVDSDRVDNHGYSRASGIAGGHLAGNRVRSLHAVSDGVGRALVLDARGFAATGNVVADAEVGVSCHEAATADNVFIDVVVPAVNTASDCAGGDDIVVP
jgi:hypothetical protein